MGEKLSKLSPADHSTAVRVFEKLSFLRRRQAGIEGKRPDASLGVIRLDYEYPPAPGDIDHPGSFGYKVHYCIVKGLTFAMCQSGVMTKEVTANFASAIRYLDEEKHVSAITGDCGFMMWFQDLARRYTHKPVFMSSLVQLAAITKAFDRRAKIAILTANSKTLLPMYDLITKECGVSIEENRFIIVGCQDVPGFEAVELGEKVDTMSVQPGIVNIAAQTLLDHPDIQAILLECTELPPYADALRYHLGLPVYDAITCADSFIDGILDNPRFGLEGWMHSFDPSKEKYKLSVYVTEDDNIKCAHCHMDLVQEVGTTKRVARKLVAKLGYK